MGPKCLCRKEKQVLVADLGVLSGPLLVYGGPLSNRAALAALFALAERAGIPAERRICTGDMAGYGADAPGCVALVRATGGPVAAGNVERQLAADAEGCGCGFAPGSACDRLSGAWYGHARAQVGAVERAWMSGLPDVLVFTHAGLRCAVIHGGVSDIARYLWPVSPEADFAEEVAALAALTGPVARIYAGHCGLPFRYRMTGVDWVNPGAIGLPPNDGHPETCYALVDAAGEVSLHRLACDADTAAAEMRAAGLVQGNERALLTGLWPSEDVLPPALRAQSASSASSSASG